LREEKNEKPIAFSAEKKYEKPVDEAALRRPEKNPNRN